jgi:hypothetical protein
MNDFAAVNREGKDCTALQLWHVTETAQLATIAFFCFPRPELPWCSGLSWILFCYSKLLKTDNRRACGRDQASQASIRHQNDRPAGKLSSASGPVSWVR